MRYNFSQAVIAKRHFCWGIQDVRRGRRQTVKKAAFYNDYALMQDGELFKNNERSIETSQLCLSD